MKIRAFGVEQWIDEYENRCELNLAETCVESLTIAELLEMSGDAESILSDLLPMKLDYGAIPDQTDFARIFANSTTNSSRRISS